MIFQPPFRRPTVLLLSIFLTVTATIDFVSPCFASCTTDESSSNADKGIVQTATDSTKIANLADNQPTLPRGAMVNLQIPTKEGVGICYGLRVSATQYLTDAHCLKEVKKHPEVVQVYRISDDGQTYLFEKGVKIDLMNQDHCKTEKLDYGICADRDLGIITVQTEDLNARVSIATTEVSAGSELYIYGAPGPIRDPFHGQVIKLPASEAIGGYSLKFLTDNFPAGLMGKGLSGSAVFEYSPLTKQVVVRGLLSAGDNPKDPSAPSPVIYVSDLSSKQFQDFISSVVKQ